MIEKSYAKINLSINVKNKLDNGYHDLDMVMSLISLHDKIYLSKQKEDKIDLTCTNRYVPTDEKNVVYQVAQKVKEKYHIKDGVKIHIVKYIPMQAGLGGGSSNAATVLFMLNKMFRLNLSVEEMVDLVKDIGSDIPYFIYQTHARVQGVGQIVQPLKYDLSDVHIILAKPKFGVSTKKAYETLNLDTCDHPDIDKVVMALENNDYDMFIKNCGNSLEESAIRLLPDIKANIDQINDLGVDKCLMCGSGSTILAFTKDMEIVKRVKAAHKDKTAFVFVVKVINNV